MNSSISLTTQRINEILTKLEEANNPDLTLATILGLVRVLGELERLYEKQLAEKMKASR